VLRTELENAFEDFMFFEMKSVTFSTPYNFDTYKADVVVPMDLVELQCDSFLREKFNVGGVPRIHTYTQIYKSYSISLPTVGNIWWHIFV
jgi:hypothetical protein